MSRNIEYAVQLYNEAAVSEEQGNFERAEMLYMESRRIFEHEGGIHRLDAAVVMKMVAFMKEKYGDHAGALAATQESLKVWEPA